MKILVIGGSGFIGSHVCDALLEQGHSLRIYGRKPELYRPPLQGVEYVLQNFEDRFALSKALTGVDCVVHLVSSTVPSTSNLDPIGDINTNLSSTVSLLELMRHTGPKRLIFLSSGGTVYGDTKVVPIPETHSLHPVCSYGVVKVAIENYLFMYQSLYGIESVILRASNPYGPRQPSLGVQGLIATLLFRIKNNQPMEIWGDGEVVRDYFYATDLANLCAKAVTSPVSGTFNAGSGSGTSINTIIKLIADVTQREPIIDYFPKRKFDIKEVYLDISKAKETFHWSPQIDLKHGIQLHWDWLKKHSFP